MDKTQTQANNLLQIGVLLFTIGLITGLGIPFFANPRLGLSGHMAAIMNGLFLMILGVIWYKIQLSSKQQKITYILLIFSTFANWLGNVLGAIWAAGETIVPIAANGQGTVSQELILKGIFGSLSVGILIACFLILKGLRKSIGGN